ncbi:MAG: hypothetical protein DRR04_00030 [Gammaproteobacteria bacterium]|nr:MAG: hypothetical protein DRQ97_00455 [Gammaproteobacteria bacterium]RLA62394.1 MAG: hypothetical protein DRR04_00030 [Gammaproteobacteria bacterium]
MTQRTISLVEKKSIIIAFLGQCNDYSDVMVNKYQAQLQDENLAESAAQKIHDWNVYRQFNEYAVQELGGDELDHWFR